jgi:hypothetical protein
MAYVSKWEPLSAARERVMTATGRSKDEAQTDICRAIADRAINIRGKLKEHMTKLICASVVLEGKDFDIAATITAEELDWEQSRPAKPWIVRRGAVQPAGYWYLESIELSRIDVTNVLCTVEQPSHALEHAPGEARATSRSHPASDGNATSNGPRSRGPQSPVRAPARRRGARPTKFQRVSSAMREDVRQGRRTMAELKNMLEKNLAEAYGVSRDTARKARNAVVSEFGGN